MTQFTEEQLRIRGYLQAQAAKLSVPELIAKVQADQEQVRAAAAAVPTDRWDRRVMAGEWTANDVMDHVAETSALIGARIAAVLAGDPLPQPIPDEIRPAPETRPATAWWALIEADRAALWQRLATVTGTEQIDVTWRHRMFGELNWREWLLFLRIHDLDHAGQLRQIADA